MRARLGKYFEILSQGIYGGNIKELQKVNESSGKVILVEPDITLKPKKYFKEIKSVSPGECLKLTDEQISKCMALQLKSFDKFPNIDFEIFRHGVRKLVKRYNKINLLELVNEISNTIQFMISLPFSVIYKIYLGKCEKYTSRYNGLKWDNMTRLNSSGLNNFLLYPAKTFEEFEINPSNFIFSKFRFSENVTMNFHKVSSFPILIVREKDHLSEIKNLESIMQGKDKGKNSI